MPGQASGDVKASVSRDARSGCLESSDMRKTQHTSPAGPVVVGVTDDLTGRFPAGDLVTKAVQAVGGAKGGGRPDMAQGGGPDGAKAADAIAAVKAVLAG